MVDTPDDGDGSTWASACNVDVDGEVVEYYPRSIEMPGVRIAGLPGYDYRHDVALDRHPRLRRAVVRTRIGGEPRRQFGALRFADGVDLGDLDARVRARRSLGEAGGGAVFGVVREIICRQCRESSLLLVVEPSLPLTTQRRLARHRVHSRCPHCGAADFHSHLEVLAG